MTDDLASSLRPALVMTALFAILLGLDYPLALTGIGQALFPHQANGSLIRDGERVVGSALIGQAYAATGKTRDLSKEDLDDAAVAQLSAQIESSVVHYGDITMTFLNNWFRTDRSGTSLLYASAVAVEEKSVIDYNQGNPDGVLSAGETPRKPRVQLVAIYPKEGTLYSDSPLYTLDADWVSADQKQAAQAFIDYAQRPEAQRQVLEFGFRPGNPDVATGAPITAANGVDPDQPTTLLQVPSPPVMLDLLAKWREQRKGARVLLVLDISGSMGDPADPDDQDGPTKLDLAKKAAIESLGEFNDTDEVGLRVFTTNLGSGQDQDYLDLLPIAPMAQNREALASKIRDQFPQNATPLYDATRSAFDSVVAGYDRTKINAVVLLTDGDNDDGETSDDRAQLSQLLDSLSDSAQGEDATPVRIFPIAYGREADLDTLKEIAEATNANALRSLERLMQTSANVDRQRLTPAVAKLADSATLDATVRQAAKRTMLVLEGPSLP